MTKLYSDEKEGRA